MKRILVSFLLLCLVSFSTQVKSFAYSADPEKFISEIIDEVKLILNSNVSKEEKAEKLSVIALKTVDVKGIGYYTLGKKRKEITPEDIKRGLMLEVFLMKNRPNILNHIISFLIRL